MGAIVDKIFYKITKKALDAAKEKLHVAEDKLEKQLDEASGLVEKPVDEILDKITKELEEQTRNILGEFKDKFTVAVTVVLVLFLSILSYFIFYVNYFLIIYFYLIVVEDPVRKLVDEFKSKLEFGEELFKKTIEAIVNKVEDSIDDVLDLFIV
jgi:predicted PurR-regulated permease PerM